MPKPASHINPDSPATSGPEGTIILKTPELTMAEIAALKAPEIEEVSHLANPGNALSIKDVSKFPEIAHLHLGWISPRIRNARGMENWRWVTGELADYIRSNEIVRESIGSSPDGTIRNGDLVLGFMHKETHEGIKKMRQKMSRDEVEEMTAKGGSMDINQEFQQVESTSKMTVKSGEQRIGGE